MAWQFEYDRSTYTQLLEQICMLTIPGVYPIGNRLPPVRDLAAEATVNPNTIQKALSELERSGFIYSQQTSGRYITEDTGMIRTLKEDIAKEEIKDLLKTLEQLGSKPEETTIPLQETIKEMKS